MANYHCRHGHTWKGKSSLSKAFDPAELICPKCEAPAETFNGTGQSSLRKAESGVLAEAHARFTTLVTEWPCFFADRANGVLRRPDHSCWGRKDPHHLIPARFIKAHYGDLPDPELADILYAPIIGVPLCRRAHDAVERHSDYVYRHELDPALIVQCQEWERRYPDRRSLLEQLRLESPVREVAA